MPSKKKRSAQAASKKLLADRRKLKSMGLLSRKVDLRKKPSTYQKKLIERYKDLLSGKAVIVEARDKKQAAKFKDSFSVKDNKIIVPKEKGERVTFSKKTGELKTSRKVGGKRVTKTISDGELAPLKKGQYYVIAFAGGQRFRTNDFKTLQTFMEGYEKKQYKPFKDWRKYVQIETIEEMEDEEYTPISRYKPLWKKQRKTKRQKRRGK